MTTPTPLFRPMIMRAASHGGTIYYDVDMGIPEVWLTMEDAAKVDLRPWAAERLETTLDVVEHAVGFEMSFKAEESAYVEDGEILVYLDNVECARCGEWGISHKIRDEEDHRWGLLCEACWKAIEAQDNVNEERFQGVNR